uniref:RING-type domain-containing protein n=1 Tax=Oncorhynchus tshawytscha TaxID=74940 RepID=A0AAZ3QMP7_ONCTS
MSSLNVDSSLLPEEQFLCSICLNVFTDPVTTPCGHTFCKACISGHWDNSEICQCLKCQKRFYVRPEVSTNSVIEGISMHIKRRKLDIPECLVAPWEVACDVCSTIKLKALKSCLVCLTSYCEIHLEPHQRVVNLKRHKLIDPVENLEDRMCKKHERGLELFCRTDQTCVCVLSPPFAAITAVSRLGYVSIGFAHRETDIFSHSSLQNSSSSVRLDGEHL